MVMRSLGRTLAPGFSENEKLFTNTARTVYRSGWDADGGGGGGWGWGEDT